MKEKTYSEKLNHPKWQRKRLEIMNRDNFTCQKCGDDETLLHIHHLRYKNDCDPWDYEDSDLTTLCKDCHEIIEQIIKENDDEIDFKTLIIKKFLTGWSNNGGLVFASFYSKKYKMNVCLMNIYKERKNINGYYFSDSNIKSLVDFFKQTLNIKPTPIQEGTKEWYLNELKKLGVKSPKIKSNTGLKKLKELYDLNQIPH